MENFTLAEKKQIAAHFANLARWAPGTPLRMEAVERTADGFRLPAEDAARLTAQATEQMRHVRSGTAGLPSAVRAAFEFFGLAVPTGSAGTDLDAEGAVIDRSTARPRGPAGLPKTAATKPTKKGRRP